MEVTRPHGHAAAVWAEAHVRILRMLFARLGFRSAIRRRKVRSFAKSESLSHSWRGRDGGRPGRRGVSAATSFRRTLWWPRSRGYLSERTAASPSRPPAHVEGVTIGILGDAYGVTVELDAPGPFDAELCVTGPGVLALVSGAGRLCVLEPDPTTSVPCSRSGAICCPAQCTTCWLPPRF